MKTRFLFDVPQEKKLRVIIDTDAACEADDPFAIVQALLRLCSVPSSWLKESLQNILLRKVLSSAVMMKCALF